MQLSSSALAQVVSLTNGPAPNYAAAYAVVLKDLTASNPNVTGPDADVLHWLAIAEQVNSGATTPQAIAIRANNVAASELVLGKQIALFGPEEQASSNAIAQSFLQTIIQNNGVVPDFAHIMQIDAQSGLAVLGLPQYAWAGAVPDAVASSSLVGFTTDNFYDNLTSAQQTQENVIHGIASALTVDEIVGLNLGLSQTTIDDIIQTDAALDTQQPFLAVFQAAASLITSGGTAVAELQNIDNSISQLSTNVRQGISATEVGLQSLFGLNSGITDTTGVTDAGPNVDLILSNPSSPTFDIYVSGLAGPITVSGDAATLEDITFLNSQGTAVIDNPISYLGTIYSFVPNGTIDLAGAASVAGAALSAGDVLTVQDTGGGSVPLNLDATENYSGDSFLFAPDGAGGTNITAQSDTLPIAFTGADETLLVVNPGSLTGTISNFQRGDTIDLAGISAASVTLNGSDALSVMDSQGNALSSIQLSSSSTYAGDFFEPVPDGSEGTNLTIPTVAVTPLSGVVNEGDGSLTFTITRSGDTLAAATVYISTTDGSTVSGENINAGDFNALSYDPVTFAAGSASTTVSVTINNLGLTNGASKDFGIEVTDGTAGSTNVLASSGFVIKDGETAGNYDIETVPFPAGYESADIVLTDTGLAEGTAIVNQDADDGYGFIFNINQDKAVYFSAPEELGYVVVDPATEVASATYAPEQVPTYVESIEISQSGEIVGNVFGGQGLPFAYDDGDTSVINVDPTAPLYVNDGGGGPDGLFTGPVVYPFPGVVASAAAINDSGEVVGSYSAFMADPSAPVYTVDGVEQQEGSMSPGQPFIVINGTSETIAIPGLIGGNADLLNNAGDVAGTYITSLAESSERGFLLSNGTISTFQVPFVGESFGISALSENGEVVGHYETANSEYYAFTFNDGTITSFHGPGYAPLYLTFINNSGLMAGVIGTSTGQAVTFNGGSISYIPLPTGTSDSVVTGLNDPGEVVGYFSDSSGVHGFVYNSGVATQFDVPGATSTKITSINDAGDIAGSYEDASGSHTFVGVPVPCFARGTRIATPAGDILIEELAVGDVVQANDAGVAAIKWIGHRRVDCRNHPKPQKVWPVRVRVGAFGDDMPRRDLWLSPDHAVFVDDVLIPIKRLINGTTIEQVPMDEVTYYHIELPQHDVLLAEGLPAESYLDTGDRFNFENSGGPIALHPEFSARRWNTAQIWEAFGCARLVMTGPELDAVRQRVNIRAVTLDRQQATLRHVA